MKEYELIRVRRRDYWRRRQAVLTEFGLELNDLIKKLYGEEEHSAQEIVEKLKEKGIDFSAKSLQRMASEMGIIREKGDAYRLAVKKGRIHWALKDPLLKANRKRLPNKVRFEVLRRDGYKCLLCGSDSATTRLEVDHIVPLSRQGETSLENLRTLCHECNVGKRIVDKER